MPIPRLPGALKTAAFTYDNALAAISLVACGDTVRAGRIGQALVAAVGEDRRFKDGRIRNAYRAGGLESGTANLSGWWDKTANRWDEDAYQDGTSTGNAAWAALALLNLHKATGQAPYLASALRAARLDQATHGRCAGPGGLRGRRVRVRRGAAAAPLEVDGTQHRCCGRGPLGRDP